MAHLVPEEDFSRLVESAEALLERGRELAALHSLPRDDDESTILDQEAQTFSLSAMALAAACPLTEEAMLIAIGGVIGTLMAQGMSNHARLWQLCRSQIRSTYDEITEATRPRGNA